MFVQAVEEVLKYEGFQLQSSLASAALQASANLRTYLVQRPCKPTVSFFIADEELGWSLSKAVSNYFHHT